MAARKIKEKVNSGYDYIRNAPVCGSLDRMLKLSLELNSVLE